MIYDRQRDWPDVKSAIEKIIDLLNSGLGEDEIWERHLTAEEVEVLNAYAASSPASEVVTAH